jgi:hypothetical protein
MMKKKKESLLASKSVFCRVGRSSLFYNLRIPNLMEYPTKRTPDSVGDHGYIQHEAEDTQVWNVKITARCTAFVLENIPEANTLRLLIDESLKEWRSALSHHTTKACQPRKHSGSPVFSLEACGIERCQRLRDGTFSVNVELPNSFENGDAIQLSASGEGDSKPKAKRDVVVKLLTMLLTIGPQKVHLPASAFHDGQDAIDNIREVAACARENLFVLLSLDSADDYELADLASLRNLPVHARWLPEPRKNNRARRSQTASAIANFTDEPPEEAVRRISRVLEALVKFCRMAKDGKFWPSFPTKAQRQFLMANVEPGALRTIVEDSECLFKVEEEVTEIGLQWYIKLQKHDQERTCVASSNKIPVQQTASPTVPLLLIEHSIAPRPTRPCPAKSALKSASKHMDDAGEASSSSIAPRVHPRNTGAITYC